MCEQSPSELWAEHEGNLDISMELGSITKLCLGEGTLRTVTADGGKDFLECSAVQTTPGEGSTGAQE